MREHRMNKNVIMFGTINKKKQKQIEGKRDDNVVTDWKEKDKRKANRKR